MEIFAYFFLGFILAAIAIAFLTRKSFLFCLGNMFMLAAAVIIAWSLIIDDGSRRGMDALVLAIMWGMAAGSFFVGFILRKLGVSQARKKALPAENAAEKEEVEAKS